MTDEKPERPADKRPDDEPYYIDSKCPQCGTALMYYHMLTEEQRRENDAFADPDIVDNSESPMYDEFVCPKCLDGIHMDWPEEYMEEIMSRGKEIPVEEPDDQNT